MWRRAARVGEFLYDMFRDWVGQVTGGLSLITVCFALIWPRLFDGDKGLLLFCTLFFSISAITFFLASLSAWSKKKTALVKSEKALEDAIDKSRPEVTAEFTKGPTQAAFMHGGPQVQLNNRGESDAWQTRIRDIAIGDQIISFHCPPILEKGKPYSANCSIKGVDPNSANGLEAILYRQAQEQLGKEAFHGKEKEVATESYTVSFDLNVEWKDSRDNPFESTGRVTYSYINRMARTEFPGGIRRLPKSQA